ncbi:MAG: hypothetical protein II688_06795, partial [Lachnospiraceae bacterium]|nr:hypothetical protein [Lachnospiraceae bacterium]
YSSLSHCYFRQLGELLFDVVDLQREIFFWYVRFMYFHGPIINDVFVGFSRQIPTKSTRVNVGG